MAYYLATDFLKDGASVCLNTCNKLAGLVYKGIVVLKSRFFSAVIPVLPNKGLQHLYRTCKYMLFKFHVCNIVHELQVTVDQDKLKKSVTFSNKDVIIEYTSPYCDSTFFPTQTEVPEEGSKRYRHVYLNPKKRVRYSFTLIHTCYLFNYRK